MNVPNITQSLGSAPPLPRPDPLTSVAAPTLSGATALGSSIGGGSGSPTATVGEGAPTVSLARLAWFDVNDDGQIDPRPAAAGGDGTLLVPSHSVDFPAFRRSVTPLGVPHPVGAHDSGGSRPANAAQTNRAVESYQRYGQTPAAAGAALPPVSPASGADRTISP